MNKNAWIFVLVGLIAGAAIGYFYRPAAVLVGQLPFDVVMTRGGNLQGLEQIYLETAKTSFNYVLGGGIAGAVLGAVIGMLTSKNKS